MSTSIEITITEKQILHIFYDYPHLLDDDSNMSIVFITDIANDFMDVFLSLHSEGLSFLPEHILKYKKENITMASIEAITNTNYQDTKLNEYVKELNDYRLYQKLENKILKETLYELKNKDNSHLDVLQKCYTEFGAILEQLEDKEEQEDKQYLTFYDMVTEHKLTVEERSRKVHQSSGCPNFDLLLPQVIPGLITVAGYSGSCKSTFVHYLQRQRIIKRLPTISINTELSKVGFNDGMLPSFLKVNYHDLLGIDENENIDYDDILNKFKTLDKYKNKNKFLYYNRYSCSIKDIETMMVASRESMGLDRKSILFCFVDLLSMLKEFNNSDTGYNKAEVVGKGIDYLNEIALTNNTLLIGTLQLKRKDDKKKIERLEQVENYRPNISDIKSSGAYEERSRMVLAVHNPWSITHRNPCNQVIRDMVDPIIDIDLCKDTYFQQTGKRISYLYQNEYKTFAPYKEEED